jgi:hypothetical protein
VKTDTNRKNKQKDKLGRKNKAKSLKRNIQGKKIARILSFYGREIVFHRTKNIEKAKTKSTPSGKFASKIQIAKDKRTFKC